VSGPTDLGQTYRYRQTITDAAGTPADAGTVVVTITKPDGSTATPTVGHAGVGLYDIAYLTTMAGTHNLSGSATGGVLGTEVDVWEDVFTVETPLRMFISVDEASAHLRAAGVITSSADREQLRWLCMVASDAVERDLSRTISRRTVTETYDGGRWSLLLRSTPIISITTVTENGVSLAVGDWTVNSSTGQLYRGGTLSTQWWAWGRQNIAVTYVAGYTDPPRIVRKVALNGVQRSWQESQVASHPLLDEAVEAGIAVAVGTLTPLELAAYNSLRAVGIA
jgi:hypothetical protein